MHKVWEYVGKFHYIALLPLDFLGFFSSFLYVFLSLSLTCDFHILLILWSFYSYHSSQIFSVISFSPCIIYFIVLERKRKQAKSFYLLSGWWNAIKTWHFQLTLACIEANSDMFRQTISVLQNCGSWFMSLVNLWSSKNCWKFDW